MGALAVALALGTAAATGGDSEHSRTAPTRQAPIAAAKLDPRPGKLPRPRNGPSAAQRPPLGATKRALSNLEPRLRRRPPPRAATALIVRFRGGVDRRRRSELLKAAGARVSERLPLPGAVVVRPARGAKLERLLAILRSSRAIAYAQPDYRRVPLATPSDPLFPKQWALVNTGQQFDSAYPPGTAGADIDADAGWEIANTFAAPVAVVDTGVALGHPDLAPELWTNDAEARGRPGVDDDGNGFVDDVHGWDFAGGDPDPSDYDGHGTHVAGTIAARANDGTGVAGVAWRGPLMPLRVVGIAGATDSALIAAFDYAARMGARVVNVSLGGPGYSPALKEAIDRHPDVLFVTAAGNDGIDNDSSPQRSYPCALDSPNLVCVAATDQNDGVPTWSNFGAASVDLGAPGNAILSTWPDRNLVVRTWSFDDGTPLSVDWVTSTSGALPEWGLVSGVAGTGLAAAGVTIAPSAATQYGNSEVVVRTPLDLSAQHGCRLRFRYLIDDPQAASGGSPAVSLYVKLGSLTGAGGVQIVDTKSGDTAGALRQAVVDPWQMMLPTPAFDGRPDAIIGFGVLYDHGTHGGRVIVDDVRVLCVNTASGSGSWQFSSGTSMAAPHVAGAAALVLARRPDLTPAQLRELLLRSADPVQALAGRTVSGGRLDLRRLLDLVAAPIAPQDNGPARPPSPGPAGSTGGGTQSIQSGPTSSSAQLAALARSARIRCPRWSARALRCKLVLSASASRPLTLRFVLRKARRTLATANGRLGRYVTLHAKHRLRRGTYALEVRLGDRSGRTALRKFRLRLR